ncbi:MAG TPA: magnesium/cobalt efflux protein, partial [Methylophaga aminisulfidivorans]|nr:magnesium/cobalt efflux protein [Methylophaga aminisulfidivorans]
MSEGRQSRLANQSWVRRLSNLFMEPQDQEQLIELIRSASERHILDS